MIRIKKQTVNKVAAISTSSNKVLQAVTACSVALHDVCDKASRSATDLERMSTILVNQVPLLEDTASRLSPLLNIFVTGVNPSPSRRSDFIAVELCK